MIGFYDYTVILTYGGLIFALMGIFQAFQGNWLMALLLLGGCLFCDTMDGRVARAKKNRTPQETRFGIQIDSLCDTVSFGIFPAVLCYTLGLQDGFSLVLLSAYCLCCVIRLGYFNVLAEEKKEGEKSVYHGLPVVGFAVLLPAACMLSLWLPEAIFLWVLRLLIVAMGSLYILDFKLNKPGMKVLLALCVVFWVPMAVLWALA